jgi:histidine kinase/DNA gyrase B/HSP90-like ATPase
MKVAQDNSPALLSNANGQVVDIQIGTSREAQMMIMNVLTNTLYTNKPEAVWREYGCNAADANVEAGRGDIPIEITLPTRLSAEAVIRDFGHGMTEGRMLGVYCKLGESTKRDSNEETGMIGIGAKAGYAYGDMFTVISYNGGIKTVYQFFKDGGMPRMMMFSREECDAPDGTEVRVPVREHDLEEFRDAAERVFSYFKVPPIVHGGTLNYERGHPVFKGKDWTVTGNQRPVAIMGNVGYKIDTLSLDLDYGGNIQKLLELGIEIYFEIGELEIAATREALQYKDGTKKLIRSKCKRIISELAVIFKDQIAAMPNLWEAKKAYAEAFEKIGSNERQMLRDVIDGKVTWNGAPIDNGRFALTIEKADEGHISINSYGRRMRRRYWSNRVDSVTPRPQLTIVENDLPKLTIPPSRLKGHFERHAECDEIVVLTFRSQSARDNFWKLNQMDGVPIVLFSTLQPSLSVNNGNGGPSAHKAKHTSKAFVFDEAFSEDYRCKIYSMWWKVEDVDRRNGAGAYVVIRKFKVEQTPDDMNPSDLVPSVRALRTRGLLTGKLYAFKRNSDGKLPKLGPGWVPLKKHVENQLKDYIAKHGQDIADFNETLRVSALLPSSLASHLPDCLARQCIETREKMHTVKIDHALVRFVRDRVYSDWIPSGLFSSLPNASTDLEKLQEEVTARYPMLTYWNGERLARVADKSLTNLSEYIKLVEK